MALFSSSRASLLGGGLPLPIGDRLFPPPSAGLNVPREKIADARW
jgi:hypothetical protein